MSDSNMPYSVTNPPNAPKKRIPLRERRLGNVRKLTFEEPRIPEWKVLADTGYVRRKFLRWTPEDVEEMDDLETLEMLRSYYTPASQPQNHFEAAYCQCIIDAVNDRLYVL